MSFVGHTQSGHGWGIKTQSAHMRSPLLWCEVYATRRRAWDEVRRCFYGSTPPAPTAPRKIRRDMLRRGYRVDVVRVIVEED